MAKLARGFAFLVYPESAPENWREILDDYHIQWAESPLHCFDVNPTGEVKKPHYHVVVTFEGKKSQEQVKELVAPINAALPIPLNSVRGMIRYFAHLDNPEKYQYPVDQIIGHGGMDVQDLLRVSASARYSIICKMTAFIREECIMNYADLFDYAVAHHPEDWLPILCDSSTYVLSQYIKANRERLKEDHYDN